MALESISNTVATYHEPVKTVQKAETQRAAVQTQVAGTTAAPGAGTTMVTKTQQEGGSEGYQQQKDGQANTQRIKSVINQANSKMKQVRTRFEYAYHDETNRISIKVIDKETQEVIREIPEEESLEMLEKIWEIAGILVDEKR
ncbi:MAG: flagellar protein FlaG protein [Anaerocolumna sp.]|jgi:flagellar protein FlaG|nr:flagellar protein FlaG protein [Anaerocolumna sp.]